MGKRNKISQLQAIYLIEITMLLPNADSAASSPWICMVCFHSNSISFWYFSTFTRMIHTKSSEGIGYEFCANHVDWTFFFPWMGWNGRNCNQMLLTDPPLNYILCCRGEKIKTQMAARHAQRGFCCFCASLWLLLLLLRAIK